MTGAFFSDKAAEDHTVTFGTIRLGLGENDGFTVERASSGDVDEVINTAMPGDTITLSFEVSNAGNHALYYVVSVVFDDPNYDAEEDTNNVGNLFEDLSSIWYYDATNETWKQRTDEGYVALAVLLDVGDTHSGTIPVEVPFEATGNEYQGADITVRIEVLAIQAANITAYDAIDYMLDGYNYASWEAAPAQSGSGGE